MKYIERQFGLIVILLTFLFFVLPLGAQVSIGSGKTPPTFSVLELSTAIKNGGLRMPQLTTDERDALSDFWAKSNEAGEFRGLSIYNTDNQCLEYWNGDKWIGFCDDLYIAPVSVTITPTEATTLALSTVTLTATVNPADATYAQYIWERSFDGKKWETVDGATASTLAAQAMIVGVTQYRVTVSNKAGSATSNVALITGTMPPGTGTNPNIQMYVGAFWRWRERGERLIQFSVGNAAANNYGAWTASVVWYDDQWDVNNTTNPDRVELLASAPVNLPTSGTNAENFPVTGGSAVISGTVAAGGTIAFRIGLDRNFPDRNQDSNPPARYAVVLLSYNNGAKMQKMFIRQGEGADYVMRPGDSGTGVPAGRPSAVKFVPYDLIDPLKRTPNNYNSAVALPANGGAFTDFPTKAGYFFIYCDTKAFAPDIPSGIIGAWTRGNGTKGFWFTNLEVCPVGYRRATDSANPTTAQGTGIVAGSEMRQSLWLNPPSDTISNTNNSVWGYYADGYFDRRNPVSSLGLISTPFSAVNTNSIEVAYEGRLFFNPITNASLFFSAGGFRYDNSGQLFNAGGRARYWTSTSKSTNNQQGSAWFLFLYTNTDNNIAAMYYDSEPNQPSPAPAPVDFSKTSGALVRCVKQ